MKLRTTALAALFALTLAACGGSAEVTSAASDTSSVTSASATDTSANTDSASSASSTDTAADTPAVEDDELIPTDEAVEDLLESSEEMAEDLVDSLEDAQATNGGGLATVTVGDQSWTFSPVLCAFGPEEIGQEGAEFVLSSINDGAQMYFSIDQFGHSISIDDVTNFENPSVSIASFGGEDKIVVDGKNFSGAADFLDNTTDSFETTPGTFSGTCP